MGRARYNTGLFPLPDNVLPVQLLGGTSKPGEGKKWSRRKQGEYGCPGRTFLMLP